MSFANLWFTPDVQTEKDDLPGYINRIPQSTPMRDITNSDCSQFKDARMQRLQKRRLKRDFSTFSQAYEGAQCNDKLKPQSQAEGYSTCSTI